MRIAYVALGIEPRNMSGGVGRKIRAHVELWAEKGHTARLFAMVPGSGQAGIYSYGPSSSLPGVKESTRAVSRARILRHLMQDVRAFEPDLIYLRAGSYLYPVHRLHLISPVVMELNSNDVAERALRGAYAYWLHVLTRDWLFGSVAGFVAVTREIADLPANRKYRRPECVIGNGIDLRKYQPLPAPEHAAPVITLIGSAGMPWHGVDKLIHLAELFPDLRINVVGYSREDLRGRLPPNVTAHGFLDAPGVRGVLADTDVACSSLALHRNRMQEGSSLKVPEALAYGIPILLAYRDTDLAGLKSECILELPNTEDNVAANAENIRSFAYRMLGRRLSREDVAGCIDQRAKEEDRLAFFRQVLGESVHGSG